MARELSDLMADALVAREREIAGIAPAASALARTGRRIRHRRVVRHSAESTVAVAAVAGLAAAGFFGNRYLQTPPPAVTPAPTQSQTPSPTPSSEPAPTPVSLPGLPSMLSMPDGLLATAEPGWVLMTYRPTSGEQGTRTGQYLVLASPVGERYLVADLSSDDDVQLLSWSAGATTAQVLVAGRPATLDLLTGALAVDPRTLPADAVFVASVADGAQVWMVPVDGPGAPDTYLLPADGAVRPIGSLGSSTVDVSVSPDRRLVASDTASADTVVVVDVTSGVRTEIPYGQPNAQCSTVSWIDATGLLAKCFDFTGGGGPLSWNPRLVRADLDGSVTVVRLQTEGDPFTTAGAGAYVSDGAVAFAGAALTPDLATALPCPTGVYLTDGPRLQEATGELRVAASAGSIYVAVTPGCRESPMLTYQPSPLPTTLTRLAGGDAVVLAPVPPGDGWSIGLSSWVVAPS